MIVYFTPEHIDVKSRRDDPDFDIWLQKNLEIIQELLGVKDFFFEIASGNKEGMFSLNVAGHSDNVGATLMTVGNYTATLQQYSADGAEDIDSISSSSAADTHEMIVVGLTGELKLVIQKVQLAGQARVALDTPINRVQLIYHAQTTNVATVGRVFVFVNTSLLAGVPLDTTKIRSHTELISTISKETDANSVKTIPAGKVGLVVFGKVTVTDNKALELSFWGRPQGGVFQQSHHVDLLNNNYDYFFKVPLLVREKMDIEVRATIASGVAEVSVHYDIIIMDQELVGQFLNPIYLFEG